MQTEIVSQKSLQVVSSLPKIILKWFEETGTIILGRTSFECLQNTKINAPTIFTCGPALEIEFPQKMPLFNFKNNL